MSPAVHSVVLAAVNAMHAGSLGRDPLLVNRLYLALDEMAAEDLSSPDNPPEALHVCNEAFRLRRAHPSSTWNVKGRTTGIPPWELQPLADAVVAYLFAAYR